VIAIATGRRLGRLPASAPPSQDVTAPRWGPAFLRLSAWPYRAEMAALTLLLFAILFYWRLLVVGDLDGVVVVPARLAVPVLERCEALLDTENRVRDAVRKGMAPLAAYEKFGVF